MALDNINKELQSHVIIFIGAPLSGKGTQSNLLAKALQRSHVSSGDLFRNEVSSGSILGQQFKEYMNKGELIPDKLTTRFLIDKLGDKIYNDGMILDGYPRNLSHLKIFDNILRNLDREIFVAIYLNVPKSILEQRRAQRNRNDDHEEVFQRRYFVFQQETMPLIQQLKSRNVLINIDSSSESPDEIHQRILLEVSNFREKTIRSV